MGRLSEVLRKSIIPLSFALPISTLFLLDPGSFELVWKGRAPYLIFLWLLFLELSLVWKKLPDKSLGIPAIVITTAAPNYLVGIFAFTLNDEIIGLGKLVGVPYAEHGQWILEGWALSIEYVVLTICLVACILLLYKVDSLRFFSVSIFFLGATSCFYMIDTFYPFGLLNILQGFVPVIASLSAGILNWMSHTTEVLSPEEVIRQYPYLDPKGMWALRVQGIPGLVYIAWGCAGIQSLIIYTFVILLFVKGASISLKGKIAYASIGAIGTFLVNLMRIASICVVGVHMGTEALKLFHEYVGELFFIVWIFAYLLIVIYSDQIMMKLFVLTSKLKTRVRRLY